MKGGTCLSAFIAPALRAMVMWFDFLGRSAFVWRFWQERDETPVERSGFCRHFLKYLKNGWIDEEKVYTE